MNDKKVVSYDKENDILFIHKGFSKDEAFKGNIDAGDLVLDMSTKGRIRGVELINASDFLKIFNIKKSMLNNLVDVSFTSKVTPEAIIIGLFITAKKSEEVPPAKMVVPLTTSGR